ncbi:MAG: hypothetical protein JJT94_11825 [Bernardetiaceae bacterium]|nr:hypothetical protein [Bernardetiaceae bacterium]
MRTKAHSFILLLIIAPFFTAQAQMLTDLLDPMQQNSELLFGEGGNVEGSPYLYEEWVKGTIKDKEGNVFREVDMRIDIYNNDLVIKNELDEEMIFQSALLSGVEFTKDNTNYVFKRMTLPGGKKAKYVHVIYDSEEITLLQEFKKELFDPRKVNSTKAGYETTKEQKAKVIDSEVYWLSTKKGGKLEEVSIRKNPFFKAIDSNKAKDLKDFAKDNDIDLKNPADLRRLLKHYEEKMR